MMMHNAQPHPNSKSLSSIASAQGVLHCGKKREGEKKVWDKKVRDQTEPADIISNAVIPIYPPPPPPQQQQPVSL